MSSSSSHRVERILLTRIDSCFKCPHLDFYVDHVRRNRYIMNCKHPNGRFTWREDAYDIDQRPDGIIPKTCPFEPVNAQDEIWPLLVLGGVVK